MWVRILLCGGVLASCTGAETSAPEALYFERLSALCNGQAYTGTLVSTDAVDADFQTADMRMGPATCDGNTILIPFAVGEDRSRTWVVTRTLEGVRLKHDHRHRDGTEDAVTQYGGDSDATGSIGAQDFPADAETKDLFKREGLDVSIPNTWRVEITPDEQFTYQMSRPGRLFRIEFDLSQPVEAPPPTWGAAPIE